MGMYEEYYHRDIRGVSLSPHRRITFALENLREYETEIKKICRL